MQIKNICTQIRVMQSLHRPEQVLRVPGGWGSQISTPTTQEGGKVVSITNRLSLLPGKNTTILIFHCFLLRSILKYTQNKHHIYKFKVCKSVHHCTIQINHQLDATISPVYCPDVYLQLNMFRASSRPSSRAQQLQ
jgi:hypothetical protein